MVFITHVLKAFVPLFVAIDVFGVLPLYVTLTTSLTDAETRSVDRQSLVTAFIVGAGFMAVGKAVFLLLNITMADFQVAGGLVLVILGVFDLVWGRKVRREPSMTMGIVPIGVPLIVGPAVLTTLLVLMDAGPKGLGPTATLAAFVVNLGVVWVAFRYASRLFGLLGEGGAKAMSKVVALLLAAIGVRFIRLGLTAMILQGTAS